MICSKCQSEKTHKNGKSPQGKQRYKCTACGYNFEDGVAPRLSKPKVGMSLTEFREKFDVDFIVDDTLNGLDPDIIYEKNDIIKLTGLRPGYPGLSPTIEAAKDYYGKVGSTMYFSHKDTILKLKNDAKLN
jgi:hypothetical protein